MVISESRPRPIKMETLMLTLTPRQTVAELWTDTFHLQDLFDAMPIGDLTTVELAAITAIRNR